jgi:hypothetical protein
MMQPRCTYQQTETGNACLGAQFGQNHGLPAIADKE